MKLHVAMWAAVGLLVALGWFLYSSSAFPSPITRAEPVVWNLALWTQPIVLAGFRLHFGVSVYWVLLANTITYGLIGLIAEKQYIKHEEACCRILNTASPHPVVAKSPYRSKPHPRAHK